MTVPAESSAAQLVADAIAHLREAGERVTEARRRVIETLAGSADHLSADEVAAALAGSSIHKATVYRTLEALNHAGLVTHIHLPHGATTYHLAARVEREHLHVTCRLCGSVVDVAGDLLDDVAARVEAELGFHLDAAHVALTGRCGPCASAQD